MEMCEVVRQIDKQYIILKNVLAQLNGFYNEIESIRSEMDKIKDELQTLTEIKENRKLLRIVKRGES